MIKNNLSFMEEKAPKYSTQKPYIKKNIPSKVIRHKRIFKFSIRPYFGPKNKQLQFALLGQIPKWIFIDSQTGIISGIAPNIAHRQQFLITVEAKNSLGAITQSFFIKVINSDFFETITEGLFHNLSLRKRIYRFPKQDEIPRLHELLEYIFEFIMNSNHRDEAIRRLNEKAEQLELNTDKEINYDKFKQIVEKTRPNMEAILAKQLTKEHLAACAEINNIEFRNLFRQGAQLPGSIIPNVLNELGIVDYANISDTPYGKNILDAAADRIIELKRQNLKNQNQPRFSPK